MSLWQQYAHQTASIIQKGAEHTLHGLETALGLYGTYKGTLELASAIGGGLRAAGAIAPAAALAL